MADVKATAGVSAAAAAADPSMARRLAAIGDEVKLCEKRLKDLLAERLRVEKDMTATRAMMGRLSTERSALEEQIAKKAKIESDFRAKARPDGEAGVAAAGAHGLGQATGPQRSAAQEQAGKIYAAAFSTAAQKAKGVNRAG